MFIFSGIHNQVEKAKIFGHAFGFNNFIVNKNEDDILENTYYGAFEIYNQLVYDDIVKNKNIIE